MCAACWEIENSAPVLYVGVYLRTARAGLQGTTANGDSASAQRGKVAQVASGSTAHESGGTAGELVHLRHQPLGRDRVDSHDARKSRDQVACRDVPSYPIIVIYHRPYQWDRAGRRRAHTSLVDAEHRRHGPLISSDQGGETATHRLGQRRRDSRLRPRAAPAHAPALMPACASPCACQK